MSTPKSKRSTDPRRSSWSNRFKVSNHTLVDKKLNKRLIKLLDTTHLKYGTVAKKFGRALKQKELAEYQSRLLNEYCSSPQDYLQLDIDRLVLSLELQDDDLERLLDEKIFESYPKDISRIVSVKKVGVSNLNIGGYTEHRPRYKKGYQFKLYNDSRRVVHLAVADGANTGAQKIQKRKVLRIDFVPQRFTDKEIEIIFGKLKYVLTTRRWQQLISNARVTRIDVGLNLPGIMSTFLYPTAPNEKNNKCLPQFPKKALAETTYIQHEYNSSHFIIYEKLLKELNTENDKGFLNNAKERGQLLEKLVITTRLERRFLLNKRDSNLPKVEFKNLAQELDSRLFEMCFVDPMDIHGSTSKAQGKLLRNKIPKFVNSILPKKVHKLNVCANWGQEAQKSLVQHYVDLLSNFESVKAGDIKALASEYEQIKEQNVRQKLSKKEVKTSPSIPDSVNQEVKNIIETKRKRVLINAGAGAGKTTTMVKRIEHLLNSKVDSNRIVFLSFNNDSAKDAGQRLKSIKSGVKCQTFHSWSLNLINQFDDETILNSNQSSCNSLLEVAVKKVVSNVKEVRYLLSTLLDIRVNQMVSLADAYFLKCKEHEDGAKGKHPSNVADLEQLQKIFNFYKRAKKKNKVLDYNDMLEKAYRLLNDKNDNSFLAKVSSSYEHILLDEAQDSNKLQWAILKLLARQGSSIFCVGDIAQSIYGFRGASPDMLNKFTKKFGAEPFFLTNHFRSTQEILNLTNYVRRQFGFNLPDLVTENEVGEIPKYLEADGKDELAHTLAKLFVSLLKQDYHPSDIGILFRERMDKDRHNPDAVKFNKLEQAFTDELQKVQLSQDVRGADIKSCLYTMHGAKGMEWKVCIVIDPRFKQTHLETYNDHLTLAYVALSRPQEKLFVVKTLSGKNKFKDHINSEHIIDKLVEYTDSIEYLDVNDI